MSRRKTLKKWNLEEQAQEKKLFLFFLASNNKLLWNVITLGGYKIMFSYLAMLVKMVKYFILE